MWETHDSLRRASGGFFCLFFVRSLTPFSWRHCFIAFFLVLILISDTPAAEIANRNSTRAMSPMTILSVTDFTCLSQEVVTTIRNCTQRSGVALRFDTAGVHCGGQASTSRPHLRSNARLRSRFPPSPLARIGLLRVAGSVWSRM